MDVQDGVSIEAIIYFLSVDYFLIAKKRKAEKLTSKKKMHKKTQMDANGRKFTQMFLGKSYPWTENDN